MSAHLVIRDGTPQWWMSPDVWVVPGSDPNGPPGTPIAGMPAYLWARVANTGATAANGARVDFYWANPAGQIVRGTATPIGSAFVDLAPGDQQDVLCLAAWVPTIVNGGHECVLAVAHHPADAAPLPNPLPVGFAFDPPAHDQVGQRNLSVLVASARRAPLALTVTAPERADKHARITVELGGRLDDAMLARLGLGGLRPAEQRVLHAGLRREPACASPDHAVGEREIELRVPRGTAAAVYLSVDARELQPGQYQLVHVVERGGDRALGGVSYVVVREPEGAKE